MTATASARRVTLIYGEWRAAYALWEAGNCTSPSSHDLAELAMTTLNDAGVIMQHDPEWVERAAGLIYEAGERGTDLDAVAAMVEALR